MNLSVTDIIQKCSKLSLLSLPPGAILLLFNVTFAKFVLFLFDSSLALKLMLKQIIILNPYYQLNFHKPFRL